MGTAYFLADDPREAAAKYTDPNTGHTEQIGFPLKEAVYRTNNCFDPYVREFFLGSESFSTTNPEHSENRYYTEYLTTLDYEKRGILIGAQEALNITAIIGQKGKNVYKCENTDTGTNVLGVTFLPQQLFLYSSWEKGTNSSWRPASCNTFVAFNMT